MWVIKATDQESDSQDSGQHCPEAVDSVTLPFLLAEDDYFCSSGPFHFRLSHMEVTLVLLCSEDKRTSAMFSAAPRFKGASPLLWGWRCKNAGPQEWQDFYEESSAGNSKPFKILLLGKQLTYLNSRMHLHGPYITHHLLCVRPAHEAFRIIYLISQHTHDSDLGWTAVNPAAKLNPSVLPSIFQVASHTLSLILIPSL